MKHLLIIITLCLIGCAGYSQPKKYMIIWSSPEPSWAYSYCKCDSFQMPFTNHRVDTIFDRDSFKEREIVNVINTVTPKLANKNTYFEVKEADTFIPYWIGYTHPSKDDLEALKKEICKVECITRTKINQ